MIISVASVDDAASAAALFQVSFDDRVNTVAGVRYRLTSSLPEDRMGYWRAERDGDLVGWAYGGLDAFASVRTAGFAGIVVHPAHRRRGIGSALWAVLLEHLAAIGARRIVVHSRADAGATAFVGGRGFSLEATHTTSAVDPRTVGTPPAPPPGIVLAPLARFRGDPEPVYEADHQSALDEPGPSDFSGMTYETWRRIIWDHPDCDHELGVAALANGAVIGTTFLFSDRDAGRAANAGTGVIRELRGNGIGLLMKHHSLARAAAAGITRVVTDNDDTNAPMLAINEQLGYEPFSVGHSWVLER